MNTEKVIAIVIAVVIAAGIYWAMRRKRKRKDEGPSRPMTKEEFDRLYNNERTP